MTAAPPPKPSRVPALRDWKRWYRRARAYARNRLPPGTRLPVGVLLICGGLLAFLPVLGIWMLPLGIGIAALDVVPIWRRLQRWFGERKSQRRDEK